jgi:hypothetical protein
MQNLATTQLASIFASLTARHDATKAMVAGTQLSVIDSNLDRRAVLSPQEITQKISQDHTKDVVDEFLTCLAGQVLDGHSYTIPDGIYRQPRQGLELLFPRQRLFDLQDPVDPGLKLPYIPRPDGAVALTIGGLYLDNIFRVLRADFIEAALRAMGPHPSRFDKQLYLHAGLGTLGLYTLDTPIVLSSEIPRGYSLESYWGTRRFPILRLKYLNGQWGIDRRRVFGHPDMRDFVLYLLSKTEWPLRIEEKSTKQLQAPQSARHPGKALKNRYNS